MNIFDFIETKSNKLGDKLGECETEEYRAIYRYAIFGLFSQIFTFGIGLILSYLFGVFIPFVLVTLSFVFLRIGGGGYHCSCFKNCFITSMVLFFVGVFIAFLTSPYPIIMLFIGIFSGIYIMPICPKPSKNSPSRGYKGDIKFRKKYRNTLLFLICSNLLFIYFKLPLYSTSISSGILITSFMISDFGEYIINNVWNFIEK